MFEIRKAILGHYLTVRHFYLISSILAIAAFLFSAAFLLNDYVKFKSDISNDLKANNERVEQKFSDSLFYTRLIMSYVGRQVSNNGNPRDYKFIKNVLNSYRMPENGLMSWSILSWANPEHKIVISRGAGILKESKDLSHRDYIPSTRSNPETIQTGKPVKGIISNLYSIPMGYGVIDTHRKYIGAVISGIVIKNVQSQIEDLIDNPNISFALVDIRKPTILVSSALAAIDEKKIKQALIKLKNNQLNKLSYKNAYYKRIKGYPYVIATIYNKTVIDSNSQIRFAIYLMVIFLLLSFLSLILYGFHSKIINPIFELSEFAKKIHHGDYPRKTPKFEVKEMNDLAKNLHKIDNLIKRDDRLKK